jgi:uncharacterized protein
MTAWKWSLAGFVAIYVLTTIGLTIFQRRLQYFPENWLMFDRFRSDLAIGDVHIPILVLHGDEDDVISISLARRLFELANEPKTFMLVSGGKHLVLGSAEVFTRVREWIDDKTDVARRYGDARE